MVIVPIKLLNEFARTPQFAHEGDVCADLYATESLTIQPQDTRLVGTGIAIQLPDGWEAQIRPRSGLAAKQGITVLNSPGTIDTGYRGEIKVILTNISFDMFEVNIGDRIAQIAIRPVPEVAFFEVDQISETVRGEGGFGSTGMQSLEDTFDQAKT